MSILKRLQSGLSLVEVMIAMAIGSVITVGVVQLFVANSETHRLMMGQSRMQESARFALDFMSRSIQQAGYRGCFSKNEIINTPITPPDNLPYEVDIRFGIQGFDASGVNLWSPALTMLPQTTAGGADTNVYYQSIEAGFQPALTAAGRGAGTGIDIAAVVSGTDVLTLRGLDQQDEEARVNALLGANDPVVVNDPPDGLDIMQDEMAVIHDCEKATIFRVTSISAPAGGLITIGHTTGNTGNLRNWFNTLAVKNSFNIDASVTAVQSDTYFIAPGAGENAQGSTPLSLWRKSGITAPVELVEGVEDLQVLYGISTDGDNTPNQYVVANFVTNWKEVTTIRVTVVVNSIDDVGGTSTPTHGCAIQECIPDEAYDGLVRRAFTQTIKLRNTS